MIIIHFYKWSAQPIIENPVCRVVFIIMLICMLMSAFGMYVTNAFYPNHASIDLGVLW